MARKIRRRRVFGAATHSPWHRVRVAVLLLFLVVLIGFTGYRILGLSPFDALYQTAITVTTVGYEEVGTPEQIDSAYRWFSLFLVFFGVSSALYTLGVLVEALVEGSLNDTIRLRKEQRMIDKMSGHVVIAGGGRVGRAIAQYALHHDAEIVVIDAAGPDGHDHIVIHGDATDDQVLIDAGIERASTLIAALNTDAANVYVTLSARALNPELFIVARTDDQTNEPKFFQAGADRVVNPHHIGGSRMGALAMHPTLAEFLDEVLHDEMHDIHIIEVTVPAASSAIERTLSSVLSDITKPPLVLAVRSGHDYEANPDPGRTIAPDDVLIALGRRSEVDDLRRAVARS